MNEALGALWGGAAVAVLVCSCGGGAPEQRPATSPSARPATEEGAPGNAGAPGYPGVETPAQAGAPTSSSASAVDAQASSDARGRAASVELARSEAAIAAAQGDCAAACRALASMQRATDHLCALTDGSDDGRRCEDAKKRLLAARDRVRSSCGECR